MGQVIEIQKVSVGPRYLTARVRVDDEFVLMTNEDMQGTDRVHQLIPELADHACFGDASEHFGDVLPQTELAHLFEHIAVELIARTGLGADISCGRTTRAPHADERTFDVQLDCPDDALVVGVLSSAAWIMQWAYASDQLQEPQVDAIVDGLAALIESLNASEASVNSDAPGDDNASEDDVAEKGEAGTDEKNAVTAADESAASEVTADVSTAENAAAQPADLEKTVSMSRQAVESADGQVDSVVEQLALQFAAQPQVPAAEDK